MTGARTGFIVLFTLAGARNDRSTRLITFRRRRLGGALTICMDRLSMREGQDASHFLPVAVKVAVKVNAIRAAMRVVYRF